jgi:hypothetical protein
LLFRTIWRKGDCITYQRMEWYPFVSLVRMLLLITMLQ